MRRDPDNERLYQALRTEVRNEIESPGCKITEVLHHALQHHPRGSSHAVGIAIGYLVGMSSRTMEALAAELGADPVELFDSTVNAPE